MDSILTGGSPLIIVLSSDPIIQIDNEFITINIKEVMIEIRIRILYGLAKLNILR